MSLATRCSACGTAFRVVQDQLKVSGGWVRCGHCSEVFDALQGLFDLERETPPEWEEAAAETPSTGEAAAPTAAAPAAEDTAEISSRSARLPGRDGAELAAPQTPTTENMSPPAQGPRPAGAAEAGGPLPTGPAVSVGLLRESAGDRPEHETLDSLTGEARHEAEIDAHLFGERNGARRRAPAAQVQDRDRLDFSDARYDSDLPADAAELADTADGNAARADLSLEGATPQPDFLRRAEQRARWERPSMRSALGTLAVLAGAALTLQVAHHFHDALASRWPATRPALAVWCELAGCTIAPPQRIEDISVESTALARAPDGEAFRLAVTLRNRAGTPVAVPSLDLSLTDAGGRLVARRALAPRDLKPAVTTLQPGSEVVLQTLLAADDPSIRGYTVEIFYP